MALRVGIDSGGTFTDICIVDEDSGSLLKWKVESTPSDPSQGILNALSGALKNISRRYSDISYFGHGTTVATNALIQSNGVKTGLITTAGFADLLEIGRQKRPHLYDTQCDKPRCLVDRNLRIGIDERILYTGRVSIPINRAAVVDAVRVLKMAEVRAIAVCFLYSYLNPTHEIIAKKVIEEEYPNVFVSISHEVAPEFREYERLSTTVVNAFLGPVMQAYVRRLSKQIEEIGVTAPTHVTQSNGGIVGAATAAGMPVRAVLSGPSTGVVAAQSLGRRIGVSNMITFDMGGTSSDVALIADGVCRTVSEAILHGYPIKAPMLDIHTVGAGGGSIAYIDGGGHMKVGPRSAGARPGPACYGRGNLEATVTDANVVLQTLNPKYLLNGRMKIDQALARRAVQLLADRLKVDPMDAADGIITIVTANMAKAIRVVSVQRGYDPRDFALVAFGGAGPLHAARLAQELDISTVVVPPSPGVMCASGLLETDLRTQFSTTRLSILESGSVERIKDALAELDELANAWFQQENIANSERMIARFIDVRYKGQNYEIEVRLPDDISWQDIVGVVRSAFSDEHDRLYGYTAEDDIQIVTYRVVPTGRTAKPLYDVGEMIDGDGATAIIGHRDIWNRTSKTMIAAPIYDRDRLLPGSRVAGPAVVEQMDATTFIPDFASAYVNESGTIVMTLDKS